MFPWIRRHQRWFNRIQLIKKRFANTQKFSDQFNNYINTLLLILPKDVQPYEHMNDWQKFIAATLTEKKILQALTHGRY